MNDAEKYLFDIQGFLHLKVRASERRARGREGEGEGEGGG